MLFCGFQVTKFRNIARSNWIPLDSISAVVGANGCGKSNLLAALQKFCLSDSRGDYNIAEDGPAGTAEKALPTDNVCQAKFHIFEKREIESLYSSAYRSAPGKIAPGTFSAVTGISLPKNMGILLNKNYANEYVLEFETSPEDELDLTLIRNWLLQRLPNVVTLNGHDLFSGQVDLKEIWRKRNAASRGELSFEERTAEGVLHVAGLSLDSFFADGAPESSPRLNRSAALARASGELTRLCFRLFPQSPFRFDIRVDDHILNVFVEDSDHGFPMPLAQCQPSIRWLVGLLCQLHEATGGRMSGAILLLDELGAHYSPERHPELLKAIGGLAESNLVLYTTCLDSMVDITKPDRMVCMVRQNGETTVTTGPFQGEQPLPLALGRALGLKEETCNALRSRAALLVADDFEAEVLRRLSDAVKNSGGRGLSDQTCIVAAKGTSSLLTYASFLYNQRIKTAILLNTDQEGESLLGVIRGYVTKGASTRKGPELLPLLLGDLAQVEQNEASIEDLFPLDFLLDTVNSARSLVLQPEDLPEDGSDSLGKRFAATLPKHGAKADAVRSALLPELERRFTSSRKKQDFPPGTLEKASSLFSKLNSAFSIAKVVAPARLK